jgi:hypothetical protein
LHADVERGFGDGSAELGDIVNLGRFVREREREWDGMGWDGMGVRTDLEIIWDIVVFAAWCAEEAIAGAGCLVRGRGLGVVVGLLERVSLRSCLVPGICSHGGT